MLFTRFMCHNRDAVISKNLRALCFGAGKPMRKPFALIIEDDEYLALIFTMAVQQAGFETETIQHGATAQTRLNNTRPDLVILDLHLPQVSGEKLLEQIRSDNRLKDTRVVLATADALRSETLRDRANLVLLKPISFEQLTNLTSRFASALV